MQAWHLGDEAHQLTDLFIDSLRRGLEQDRGQDPNESREGDQEHGQRTILVESSVEHDAIKDLQSRTIV